MNGEKQTIKKSDVGVLNVTPITFTKIKKLVDVGSHKLNRNSLLQCPTCSQKWSVKKWERQCKDDKMICPGCGAEHKKGTSFKTSYMDREFWQPKTKPGIPKPGQSKTAAKATVKSSDTLIKKSESGGG